MFDGKVKSIRQVSLAGKGSKADSKNTKELLENARKQREARALDRQRNTSALLIQKIVRSKLSRLKLHNTLRSTFDTLLPSAAADNSALLQTLILLPGFFRREKDLHRLLAVNKIIASISSTPENLNNLTLELAQQNSQPGKRVNVVLQLIRCSRISVETLQLDIVARAKASQPVDPDIYSLVTFLSVLRAKEHVLGTYIALRLCKYTTKAFKIATFTLHQTSNATNTNSIASDFITVLSGLIEAAVGWTADPVMLAKIPAELLGEFHSWRKAAVVHIALNLFTQPNLITTTITTATTTTTTNNFAFHSIDDWLFILQHCQQQVNAVLSTTSPGVLSSFPVLTATEQLNLLSHFSSAVLSDPAVVKRVFATTVCTDTGDGYAQLGKMFLSLVANLFGHRQFDSEVVVDTATVTSVATSAAFVNTVFGATVKPSGGADMFNTGVMVVNDKETTSVLPLQLMTQLSLYPTTSSSTTTAINTPATTATSATSVTNTTTYATIYNTRAADDTAMDVVQDPQQELLSDYIFASGVKKLEYRSGGLQNSIVAAERAKVSSATGVVPNDVLHAVRSLEQLAVLLSSRDVVAQLASVLAVQSTNITSNATAKDSRGSIKEVGDGSSAENAMDVDAISTDTTSSRDSGIVLNPITTGIVHVYTQLLLSYPSDVFASHTHPHNTTTSTASTAFSASARSTLLFSLAYTNPTAPLAPRLWRYLQSSYGPLLEAMVQMEDSAVLKSFAFARACGTPITPGTATSTDGNTAAGTSVTTPASLYHHLLSTLYLFMTTLITQLAAVDDEELLEQYKLFTHTELRSLAQFLKKWLYKLYWTEPLFDINSSFLLTPATSSSATTTNTNTSAMSTHTNTKLLKLHCLTAATKLFNHLCQRHERRAFLLDSDWCWPPLSGFDLSIDDKNNSSSGIGSVNSNLQLKNSRVKAVLTFIPQVVPFKQRVSVLHAHLEQDKTQYFTSSATSAIHAQMGFGTGILKVKVRRDHLVEDAYQELHSADSKLKGQIKVEFVSEQGLDEAGIDGGGLFKEFIDSFSKSAFNPSFGLFVPTSHQLLTPNPDSARCSVVTSEHLKYLNFVGKILGKAVYERILLESEFAGGFLNFLLDRKNALDDLYHLDEQMYKSLMQMKHYANQGGDVDALELYFEITRQAADGSRTTHELIPGGAHVKVTRHNVHSYIHTLANYKLNVEGSEQCRALRAGFQSMIPLEWIRMFGSSELQLLISGDQCRIDIADMKANIHYASGYHESQPYIQAFWNIVENMDPVDQGHLLRFVTSCSRQPLLGFGQLNPHFAIQKVPAYASQYTGLEPPQPGEAPRLPSAATCMNLLKLPLYDSVEQLREKLLYAIRSNSGFELS